MFFATERISTVNKGWVLSFGLCTMAKKRLRKNRRATDGGLGQIDSKNRRTMECVHPVRSKCSSLASGGGQRHLCKECGISSEKVAVNECAGIR